MKLIYEKSQPGRRGIGIPKPDLPVPDVPAELRRAEPPRLPELAEPEVLRHFTELSTRNFGIDTGFYPLGSCTMKYNPRINERLAGLPGFASLHPLADEDAAQGALELEWELQAILLEVTIQGQRVWLVVRSTFWDHWDQGRTPALSDAPTAVEPAPAGATSRSARGWSETSGWAKRS